MPKRKLNYWEVVNEKMAWDGSTEPETREDLQRLATELKNQGVDENDFKLGPQNGVEFYIGVYDCPFIVDGKCTTRVVHAWKADGKCGPFLGGVPQEQCKERERWMKNRRSIRERGL
jgi:hypothetical protein